MNSNKDLLAAPTIRNFFTNKIAEIKGLIVEFEESSSFNSLSLKPYSDSLSREQEKLENSTFRCLVIGDFNRGKSSIINVLLGKEILPTGAIFTTAVPTFIQYGGEETVKIFYKDDTQEKINLSHFTLRYTHDSPSVKKSKQQFVRELEAVFSREEVNQKWIAQWLGKINYACLESPVSLLQEKVEFIDTAGLNISRSENEKNFGYVKNCQAIFFVLSATEQITEIEQEYIQEFLNAGVDRNSIFFLINKWEQINESDRDTVKSVFSEKLAQSLSQEEAEIEELWGTRIFTVSAYKALEELKRNKSWWSKLKKQSFEFQDTGFPEFTKQLGNFLKHERLRAELAQPLNNTVNICNLVIDLVEQRLITLQDDLIALTRKQKQAQPYFDVMAEICSNLDAEVSLVRQKCAEEVIESYKKYFANVCQSFNEKSIEFPDLKNISDSQRSRFVKKLEQRVYFFLQEEFEKWNKNAQARVSIEYGKLKLILKRNLEEYNEARAIVQTILENQQELNIGETTSSYTKTSPDKLKINSVENKDLLVPTTALGSSFLGGALGAGGTIIVCATLSVTPIGWMVMGVSAISAILVGTGGWIWSDRQERNYFINQMKQQLESKLPEIISDKKLLDISQHIENQFEPWNYVVENLSKDLESLKGLLQSLIAEKQNNDINYASEIERLETMKTSLQIKQQAMLEDYGKYIQETN